MNRFCLKIRLDSTNPGQEIPLKTYQELRSQLDSFIGSKTINVAPGDIVRIAIFEEPIETQTKGRLIEEKVFRI